MNQILALLVLASVILITNAQYYFSRYAPALEQYDPYYSYGGGGGYSSYYDYDPYSYYTPRYTPSYGRGLQHQDWSLRDLYPSYRQYETDYQPLYAVYDPYDYAPDWDYSPPLVLRGPSSRPSYFWTSPASYRRMARKGNKGGKKGGGGGGGGHHQQQKPEGGWWYIRDHKGCKSGTWGKPPPKGLEREHYSQGACGYLGGHSQRGQNYGSKPGWTLPLYNLPTPGKGHGFGGGQGGGGGGGHGGYQQPQYQQPKYGGGGYAPGYGRPPQKHGW